ncbi:MAG: hypothetical protein HYV35_00090 [Lentisphaerae bacterium]|nr:hypothetical protein [Lentisphaerota bacterium]
MHFRRAKWLLCLVLVCSLSCRALAATVTWLTPAGTNYWDVPTNWAGGSVPTNGDEVVIATNNIGVRLTNSTYPLSSLLISNKATLIFSNWDTALNATNVTIATGAVLTCAGPFSNNVSTMTNRVWIACSNLTVAAGGAINVDAKGYTAVDGGAGQGPGGGTANYVSGGGYGGAGSISDLTYGRAYGAPAAPEAPGSAGGTDIAGRMGGHGGGAIRIDASGNVQVEGTISANGGNGVLLWSGGGSGGGVMITCQTFNGTNGIIRARGGNNGPNGGGAGGGGRIAILYSSAQSGIIPTPTVQIQLNGGAGSYAGTTYIGDIGTLYIPSPAILTPTLANIYGQVLGFSSWSPDSLTITNTWVRLADEGLQLTVTNDITVRGSSAKLEIGSATMQGGNVLQGAAGYYLALGTNGFVVSMNNLLIDGGGTLSLFSGMSNAVDTNWGARLSITSAVTVGNSGSGTIYSVAHSTNGQATFFRVGSLVVATNGLMSSYARGYAGRYSGAVQLSYGFGPQAGNASGGGGYGGKGGNGYAGYAGGSTYGLSNAPSESGSAGGQYWQYGGFGGGAIRIVADTGVTVNGIINANGGNGVGTYSGGGAGGSVYITCRAFAGTSTNGLITANGGNASSGGGGGGGRIAIWRMFHSFVGAASATGGTSTSYSAGTNGTIVWVNIPVPGTIATFH